jgi:DNA-binding NtrC family response regulator
MRAHGNKKAAARMLGLSRRALYRRLERLDLGDTIMRRRDAGLDAISA